MKSVALSTCLAACFATVPAFAQDASTTEQPAPATEATPAEQAAPTTETTPAEQAAPAAEAAPEATPATAAAAPTEAMPSTLSPKVTEAIGTPGAGKAMVVFFRPSKFVGGAIGFKVREKDVELGKLRNGNYFAIEVEPGQHTYVVHSEAKDVTTIEAEAGETYFLSGSISMGVLAGRPNLSPSDAAAFEASLPKLKKSKPLD